MPLGTLIFRAGLLAEEQLEDALQEGMRTGKRLGEVLVERGWLNERDLGRLLAAQKGLSFVELNGTVSEPAALELITEEKARLHATLPLRFEGESLVVAIDDPTNGLVLENLRRTLGYDPHLEVAAHGDLLRAIDRAYSGEAAASVVAEPLAQAPETPTAPPPPATPTPMPMPTVIPPAEGRAEEVQQVPPLVSASDAHIPVLASPEPGQQPEQPAPAPVQPAPLAAPPPAPVEAPLPAPVEAPAPPAPVLETPAAAPPVPEQTPEPPPAAPVVPPPAEPAAAVVQPAPAPQPEAQPAPPEPVTNGAQPDQGAGAVTLHFVVLRLSDGEQLEIGSFGTGGEAQAHAQQVIAQISAAEGQASWPFFAGRFLRPATIVSIDLVAESSDKWMGSAVRTRWAGAGQ